MAEERFLVTGSMGCIGSWTVKNLVESGVEVVATDLATDPVRPSVIMSPEQLASVRFETLDVTDRAAVEAMVVSNDITHIVHLAGLQIPFCQANPTLGAQVNVVGTVNVFEAARAAGDVVHGLAYASSLAAMGPRHLYPEVPVRDDVRLAPTTLYGAYKQANEETAKVFWNDWGVGSVGLRPYVVYGVGRDQGMTADIAKAVLAATAGRPFHIRFGSDVTLQYADDVAKIFIASARSGHRGAAVCNLRNDVVRVADFIDLLGETHPGHGITCDEDSELPYPADLDDSGIRAILGTVPHTPLANAVAESAEMYAELLRTDRIDLRQLEE